MKIEGNTNLGYIKVIEQSREEEIKMYMKCSKLELAQMLCECNYALESALKISKGPEFKYNRYDTDIDKKLNES